MDALQFITSGVLPVTALAAILLFVLKELLEARRRGKTAALKLKALKSLLAVECEQNQWALDWINKECKQIPAALRTGQKLSIEGRSSGQQVLIYERPDGIYASSPIPQAKDHFLNEYLFEAAALDPEFFERMTAAIGAVEEIRHLIRGLFDNVQGEQFILKDWAEYATGEVEDISKELGELYSLCKGVSEIPARIRPGA